MNITKLFIKSIAPKVNLIYEDDGVTCFDHDINAVIIGKDFQIDDCGFVRHIKEKHNFSEAYNYSLSIWSILHELGHYFTGDDGCVSEEEMTQYAICALMPREVADQNPELQNMYFDIPNEYKATEWAIDWIVSHPIRAKIFNKLIK